LVQARVVVRGIRDKAAVQVAAAGFETAPARKDDRLVRFPGLGSVLCQTYDRELLGAGSEVEGPCVIEEWSSTTVVPPGDAARVDEYGNIVLRVVS
jgi:N-methylhydantoinase A